MRTIIDIPYEIKAELMEISKKENVSMAEIIRKALRYYLGSLNNSKEDMDKYFGLWKSRKVNFLDYQEKIRSEWK